MTYQIDAQAALGFVERQTSHIEREVYRRKYPMIRYRELIPVDPDAPEFASSVTFYSQDQVGRAKYINGHGDDIPLVNITRNQHEQGIDDAGIGYEFSLTEIGQAQMLGRDLSSEGANAARLAFERFVDEVAFVGDAAAGTQGLFNTSGITSVAAANTFANLTPDQILVEVNKLIGGIHDDTKGVEMPDTVVMPIGAYTDIASRRLPDSGMTVLQYLQASNVYTAQTGQPLMITSHYRADKLVAYARNMEVLKLHMPMPLRFVQPQARNLKIVVPGHFRFAPINIRIPGAVRYLTGVV